MLTCGARSHFSSSAVRLFARRCKAVMVFRCTGALCADRSGAHSGSMNQPLKKTQLSFQYSAKLGVEQDSKIRRIRGFLSLKRFFGRERGQRVSTNAAARDRAAAWFTCPDAMSATRRACSSHRERYSDVAKPRDNSDIAARSCWFSCSPSRGLQITAPASVFQRHRKR